MKHCVHCGGPTDPATSFRRIVAWEKRAPAQSSRRGGADVVLREHLDEWCCLRCVERMRSGLSVEQGSLL